MKPLHFSMPIRAASTANLRESWQTKHARLKKQKTDVRKLCPKWTHGPLLVVTITRSGPKQLDVDNLAAALKGPIDGIASWLRFDDGSPLVEWRFRQQKGEPGLLVDVEAA